MVITFRNRLLVTTLLAGAATLASAAGAQTTTQPGTAPQDARDAGVVTAAAGNQAETTTGEIVVTGSLIRNPNLTSASPVQTLAEGEITLRAPNNAEEALRSLPGVSPGIGTQVNNGGNGTNEVDLRGLGVQRNLVLLDGERLVPARGDGATDLNVIPISLLQRVDLLTGGASTTYGADAVSGVVNFITRRDFTGIDINAGYKIPQRGQGRSYRADLTLGANFADDRGNAVLNMGYTKIDPIYQTRPFALFGVSPTSGRASGSSATSTPTAIAFSNGDFVQLAPDASSLLPQYAGFNFNPYNIFQTPLERKSLYSAARYDVTDHVEVYARGMFTSNQIKTIVAPSGIFGLPETVNANNPYLSSTVRNQICAENFSSQTTAAGATGVSAAAMTALLADAARYTPANCALQTGNTAFVAPTVTSAGVVTAAGTPGTGLDLPGVYRRLTELGPRVSTYQNNVYDARAGVRVDVTSSIKLDVSGSYGRSEQTQTQSGYVLNSRVGQALYANNTTTCVNTANSCVPLNIFGPSGSITAAQVAFIQGQSTIRINTELKQAKAVLTGDFGYTVPSAANPIAFAVGGEYRQYTYERIPDAFAQNPSELGGAGGAVLPFTGSYDVKEGFGEVIAPIINDKPFFQELSVEAGIRYSAYSIQAAGNPKFNATTYKGGLTYQPVEGVRLRGNYQHAVRAPNISELFAPVVTGLTSLTVDPCALTATNGNTNLTNICLAQGAPAGTIGKIPQPSANQPNSTGGGNANIKPEKANTFTIGAVLTPQQFVPGFSLSVDYYNIDIKQAITAATPGDVIAACFGNITAASSTSVACTTIRRNPVNGGLSGPSATTFGLPTPLTNNGHAKTDGFDVTANYKHTFGQFGLNLNFVGNYTRTLKFQASSTSVNRDCVGYYSANCGFSLGQIMPKYAFQQRTTISFGPANISLLWRYINPVKYEGQASDYLARGFLASNRNLFVGVITNSGVNSELAGRSVNFNKIPAYHYFDLSTQFQITKTLQLTFNIQNLFDKDPPVVGSPGTGTTTANSGNTFPSTYDVLGRTFSVSARVKL